MQTLYLTFLTNLNTSLKLETNFLRGPECKSTSRGHSRTSKAVCSRLGVFVKLRDAEVAGSILGSCSHRVEVSLSKDLN